MTDEVEAHDHGFFEGEWPFLDSEDTVAISTRQVVRQGLPVLRVSHDDDGDWQVLCGTTTDAKDALIVCLGCAYRRNPEIGTLADLPRGWTAWREHPSARWTKEPKPPEDDEC